MILLEPADFISEDEVRLSDRRFEHIRDIHRAQVSTELQVGLLQGDMGLGLITKLDSRSVEMKVVLNQSPPQELPVTLLLALPRPKMLKRVLQSITTLGVKRIYLINSHRVEKSFWSSPLLQPSELQKQLILGLEQAQDTRLPQVHLRKLFKPFVEDELPTLIKGSQALVAHPDSDHEDLLVSGQTTTLAVGPEGGFIHYEVEKLLACGFRSFSLGPRILRVETAVPVLLSKLLPL